MSAAMWMGKESTIASGRINSGIKRLGGSECTIAATL